MCEDKVISFSDGAGNSYRVSLCGLHLSFTPLTPIESSSGTYSGGDPVEMELSQKQHEDVIRALVNLLNDSSAHVAERTMGTGIITVSDSATSKSVIINNSCCSNVDKTLRSITKQTARHIPD